MRDLCPIHPLREVDRTEARMGRLTDYRCPACDIHNQTTRHAGRAKIRLAETPLTAGHDGSYTIVKRPDGTFRAEDLAALARKIDADPIRLAQLELMDRRPGNVSKVRFGVATRAAAGIPMLTGTPRSVTDGLDPSKQSKGAKPALGKFIERIVVKPLTARNAKGNNVNSFWGERLWNIHPLRYARGYTIVTDTGEYSSTFNTIGEARSAIVKSGWEIIR